MATPEQVQELSDKMRDARTALIGALDGMSEQRAELRQAEADGEDGWSVKEQLSHLAAVETTYRAWVQRALTEDRPDLSQGTEPDPAAYPLEEAQQHTLAEHVGELNTQRDHTLELMSTIAPGDYERTAQSPAFGELTVMKWLRSYRHHDRMHLAQIEGRESEYQPRDLSGEEPDQRGRG